ncbi:ferredoxin [Mycobacterium sp. E2479]|uniref:ferredoxin n=1 Tax=Mycobacterium sp. E2479 TaxID=1834134 RepID=UPI0008020222|nr:ferredoxin [Mycobacterium sp. E2479]OBH52855.1 hypothetical protein A5686_09520 [Mycobacterium sp. E2479]
MGLKVRIDLTACQGYACCMMEAPELFDLDDVSGKAVLFTDDPPEEQRARAADAARACPARAITVENG